MNDHDGAVITNSAGGRNGCRPGCSRTESCFLEWPGHCSSTSTKAEEAHSPAPKPDVVVPLPPPRLQVDVDQLPVGG